MEIYTGYSSDSNGMKAVKEATSSWPPELRPDLVLVFHSVSQSAQDVASQIAEQYPHAKIAGCTTSGEHLNGSHYNNSLVISAFKTPKIKWAVHQVENIKSFDQPAAESARDYLLAQLKLDPSQLDPDKHFCLTFIDGLSTKEESVSALMAEALEGIPFLGGSAGDDLKFERTQVIANGKAYDEASVFVLAESDEPFTIIKHQHFLKTPSKIVITKVDKQARKVYEINGRNARDAYAAALNITPEELTPDVCFANPVTFRVNNELYVRSIQKIEDDGSIVFYCAVEEGMVLEFGGHEDMEKALQRDLQKIAGKAEVFLACNCILRALEANSNNNHETLGKLVANISNKVIGFDTYGEQLNGLHINQTLVGLALGRAA